MKDKDTHLLEEAYGKIHNGNKVLGYFIIGENHIMRFLKKKESSGRVIYRFEDITGLSKDFDTFDQAVAFLNKEGSRQAKPDEVDKFIAAEERYATDVSDAYKSGRISGD